LEKAMSDPAPCSLVLIRWEDSRQPCGQWRYLAALPEAKPVEVASVGWLVKDTPEAKILCQNIGDLGHPEKAQASGIMTIPTRCVLTVSVLAELPPEVHSSGASLRAPQERSVESDQALASTPKRKRSGSRRA
jgi:hypothetical protein